MGEMADQSIQDGLDSELQDPCAGCDRNCPDECPFGYDDQDKFDFCD